MTRASDSLCGLCNLITWTPPDIWRTTVSGTWACFESSPASNEWRALASLPPVWARGFTSRFDTNSSGSGAFATDPPVEFTGHLAAQPP